MEQCVLAKHFDWTRGIPRVPLCNTAVGPLIFMCHGDSQVFKSLLHFTRSLSLTPERAVRRLCRCAVSLVINIVGTRCATLSRGARCVRAGVRLLRDVGSGKSQRDLQIQVSDTEFKRKQNKLEVRQDRCCDHLQPRRYDLTPVTTFSTTALPLVCCCLINTKTLIST